jgi:phosphoenolpyruvate-protein kinase (PTS system EI component)
LLPFLVGIGLRSFSMTPHAIPSAQQSLRKINVADAQKLAQRLLSMNRLQDIAAELGTTTP